MDQINELEADKYIEFTWNAMLPVLEKANGVLANPEATVEQVETVIAVLIKAMSELKINPSNSVVDNGINKPIKLGDIIYMFGVLGLMVLLSAVACLKKKEFN